MKPVVKTTLGKISGEMRDGIAVFRGIPYGGNCDGENRFMPPVPAKIWDGIRDCTKNGPISMQFGTSISGSSDFGAYFSGGQPGKFRCEDEFQSENCLVLNVLTPGIDDRRRPVVVYIHGGGFASGSGSLVLGADQWCREEDIVVVGVNHRLNVFGYLYLGGINEKYAQSGMAGMLDLIQALQWVHDNIAFFGGDPEKVTIMGESGGGHKVNTLLAMGKAKGLFRAAIVESGSGVPGNVHRDEATEAARRLLKELGISENNLDEIMHVPVGDILEASARTGYDFAPCADEINLNYNPGNGYPEADPTLPLLVGSAEEELAAFADPVGEMTWETLREALLEASRRERFQGEENEEDAVAVSETSEKDGGKLWAAKTKIKNRNPLSGAGRINEENVDRIIAAFRAIDKKGADPQRMLYRIESMSGFLSNGAFIQAMEKAEKGQAPVYCYFFTFDAPHPRIHGKHYSWHTADLPLQMRVVPFPEETEMISREMAHAWAAFIRNGSPDTPELHWPEFTMDERQVMVLDVPCHVEADPTKVYREVMGLS